ncbi:MAG: efflux RND transporter periplasmic adaptor subunit [Cytophagales bacterium]|nr:efflux RND transporter periplasmic adaptor subunit [Cytophagales bacterium]
MKKLMKSTQILFILLFVAACETSENSEQEIKAIEDGFIVLSKEQVEAAGIRTSTVKKERLIQSVSAKGILDVPPNNRAEVSGYIGGYVSDIKVLVGMSVKKGQVLAVLNAPELFQLQQSYLEVKSRLKYLKDDYDRMKILADEKVTAKKDFLKSEADYFSSNAQLESLKQSLKLIGVNLSDLDQGVVVDQLKIRSPIEGEVAEVYSVIGEYMESSKPVIKIINPEHLHVELKVFEGDLGKLKNGQRAQFTIPQSGPQTYESEVYLISSIIDETERYSDIHAHLEEESTQLRVGAYVEAEIIISEKIVNAAVTSSIFQSSERSILLVLVSKNENEYRFEAKEVTIGATGKGWMEVKNIEEGTEYVSDGMYYLKSL